MCYGNVQHSALIENTSSDIALYDDDKIEGVSWAKLFVMSATFAVTRGNCDVYNNVAG